MASVNIKLSRDNIYSIASCLTQLTGSYNPKLMYAIKRNKQLLNTQIKAIIKAMDSKVPRFTEFETKRNDKFKECVKMKDGEPVLNDNGAMSIQSDNVKEYTEFIKALELEYKDAIVEREDEVIKLNKYLLKEVDVSIYKISNDVLPEGLLDQFQYETIFPLIIEE